MRTSLSPSKAELFFSFPCLRACMSVPFDIAWDFLEKKLCPAGKAAAKRKFKVYPSAYANGWAVQYCKGKFRGKKGGKKK